ncbi:MAG: hypothetical protein GVY13_03730 [Alphaproteobacteria bacterium]|nr:hypothetical protein [Alphaproteobacteria bacterium]
MPALAGLVILAMLLGPAPATAQSDRTELRVHGDAAGRVFSPDGGFDRLQRDRLRARFNDLRQEELRLRSERGRTGRFGPEPGAGRAGDRRRIDRALNDLARERVLDRGRLGRLERRLRTPDTPPERRVPSDFEDRPPAPLGPPAAALGLPAQDREAASEAARAYVNDLLRQSEGRADEEW